MENSSEPPGDVNDILFRCNKCRLLLFRGIDLVTAKGLPYETQLDVSRDTSADFGGCCSPHWFLNDDSDKMPDWVRSSIEEQEFTQGKLNCPKCRQKLGAFDNIRPATCECGDHSLPVVRIKKSRTDMSNPNAHRLVRPVHVVRRNFPIITSETSHLYVQNSAQLPEECSVTSELSGAVPNRGQTVIAQRRPTHESPADDRHLVGDHAITSSSCMSATESNANVSSEHSATDNVSLDNEGMPVCDSNQFDVLEQESIEENLHEEAEAEACIVDEEPYICAVCLDLYFLPHVCEPCDHVFCGPCLRRLNGSSRSDTRCPLCREIIIKCRPKSELFAEIKEYFPDEYHVRKRVENGQRRKLPHLPGSGRSPFSVLRRRPGRDRTSSELLAVSAGVCFVVCLIFLGFAVFATTVGFVMWYLLEVALDVFLDLYLDLGNFFSYAIAALALLYLDGSVPEGHASAINATVAKILGSFSRLADRTVEFINDGEVTEKINASYSHMDQFASDVSQESGHLFSKFIQATLANVLIIGCIMTFAVYRLARYLWVRHRALNVV